MGLLDQYATAQDGQFRIKVRMALRLTCLQIGQEDPATANHANRVATANKVLNGLDSWTEQAAETLALEGLSAATDDATIIGTIGALVAAGVTLSS